MIDCSSSLLDGAALTALACLACFISIALLNDDRS
jgi:hypothetical protein